MRPRDYPYALWLNPSSDRAPAWRELFGRLVAPVIWPQPVVIGVVTPDGQALEGLAYFADWDLLNFNAKARIIAFSVSHGNAPDATVAHRNIVGRYPTAFPLMARETTLVVRDAGDVSPIPLSTVESMRSEMRERLN